MPRAVLKNGLIYPLEPLPPDWQDGRELRVEDSAENDEDHDMEDWYRELGEQAAKNDPRDWARVEQAMQIADEQAKAIVRKEMGLP